MKERTICKHLIEIVVIPRDLTWAHKKQMTLSEGPWRKVERTEDI